eukprot:TRINITY_DN23406_c0_g1_i1.p1 TRINITY_DN23406_c0_g1~~TRINITY_DN23406_c0_g1_i1.p1  ORF type:complete len:129 (-),score=21.12 TRINITY_DN23406_c0_g1_i1:76-462(-)
MCNSTLLVIRRCTRSLFSIFFFLMIRRPPRSTHCISSAASDVYKRQLFEARKPKRPAIISEAEGKVEVRDNKGQRKITVIPLQGGEERLYPIPYGARIIVKDGHVVEAGDRLTEGCLLYTSPSPRDQA